MSTTLISTKTTADLRAVVMTSPEHANINEFRRFAEANPLAAVEMVSFLMKTIRGVSQEADAIVTLSVIETTKKLLAKLIRLGHPNVRATASPDGEGGAAIILKIDTQPKSVSILIETDGSYARGARYEGATRILFDAQNETQLIDSLVWLRN